MQKRRAEVSDDKFVIEFKTVVELTRMTQRQLIQYTQQLQEAIFGITEETDE